ncbi:MAG: hypothetical protein HY763_02635 [Planctomycetes bacterium]|nr:hypothetical protein [Planctomycetota bacterium]
MEERAQRRPAWARLAKLVVPGAIALGTSCAQDIRHSIVAAGLDFVEGTAGTILGEAFPVDELVGND